MIMYSLIVERFSFDKSESQKVLSVTDVEKDIILSLLEKINLNGCETIINGIDYEDIFSSLPVVYSNHHRISDVKELPTRVKECLRRANVVTVEDLSKLSVDEVSKIRNLGRKSFADLMSVFGYLWEDKDELQDS